MSQPRTKGGLTDERYGEAGLSSKSSALEWKGLHVEHGAPCHGSWRYSSRTVLKIATSCCCSCCSVVKSCLILCNPMNYSMPGFPVHHYLPDFAQTQVCWVRDAIQSSHPPSPCSPLAIQSFPASMSFPVSRLFASGGQSIGVSASAPVLPVNLQSWFLLGLTGLISLQSKGLSRVFFSTTVWKHQFFGAQPCFWSTSHIQTWLQKEA